MKRIKLTQGKYAIIDDDMAHLAAYNWHFHHKGYAVKNIRFSDTKVIKMSLHHCVMGQPLGEFLADHINGNRLDNRRENLRIVTPRENTINSRRRREGSSPSRFIGVRKDKGSEKWSARIVYKGKIIHLGTFLDEAEAGQAYLKAKDKFDQEVKPL